MGTITFHGAAQEVTGSCHLLESPAIGRVLLDCGVRQGGGALNRVQDEGFPFEPGSIDAVILSHAHLDHYYYRTSSGAKKRLADSKTDSPQHSKHSKMDLPKSNVSSPKVSMPSRKKHKCIRQLWDYRD